MIADPRLAAAIAFISVICPLAYMTVRAPGSASMSRPHWLTDGWVVAIGVSAAACIGVTIAPAPLMVLGIILGGALFAAILAQPVVGAYALLALTPLIVGIERGRLFPLLRPNEVLLLLVIAALLMRRTWWWLAGAKYPRTSGGPITKPLIAAALASTITPLIWLVARDMPLSVDDLTHAMTLPKYAALFFVFRAVVRTTEQVRNCIIISVCVGALVGLIGAAQSLGLFGVSALLEPLYTPPFQDASSLSSGRGSSTIANAISVGDVVTFNLLIVLAFVVQGQISRRLGAVATGVLLVGVAGTGQISAVILLLVGLIALGALTGTLRHLARRMLPAGIAVVILLIPVIEQRVSGFSEDFGEDGDGVAFLPPSWELRWTNLTDHFWPELFSGLNWLLGVRPFPRLEAPEGIKDFIFIESGYTFLLWTGGIPLFVAFIWFLRTALRTTKTIGRSRIDEIGCLAAGTYASLVAVAVLMLLDPHHIMRGAADLLYPMLAMSLTAGAVAQAPQLPTTNRPPDNQAIGTPV
ncbi:MAG: hypothetical protein ACR2PK_11830 [Acidimicrobiales bacterium]